MARDKAGEEDKNHSIVKRNAVGRRAKANPTKAFFVRMLTRDISLDDCILDLVDNSIDGAWRSSGQEPSALRTDSSLSDYYVRINFSAEEFRISDNCGGISLDDAVDYAFTFGRREDQKRSEYSVGVYGIGMKRAVFKLGRSIRITSTYREKTGLEAFAVPIEVSSWLSQVDGAWDFDIEPAEASKDTGVTIVVTSLTDETRARLSDPTYERTLRRILARDYMVPLMRGLRISVNGIDVKAWKLELMQNENFAPMRHKYDDGSVSVEVLAGMASLPPDDRDPDERTSTIKDSDGWYVLCNGRVVLAADTTVLTGWGDGLPKWHKQYAGFVGVVLFNSEDPELLPMTTTKRNVDVSSTVFKRALNVMRVPTRAWIDYTNARKQNLEEAKGIEKNVSSVQVFSVEERLDFKLPPIAKPKSRERLANVNYSVPLKRLRALAVGLGDTGMSYRDVGLASFDYAYDDLAAGDA